MKKTACMLMVTALLGGCVSTPETVNTQAPTTAAHQINQSIADLNWQPLQAPSSSQFTITANSQKLTNELSAGNIAAFSFPATEGALTFTLDSFAKQTVYAPTVSFFDDNNTLINQITADQFSYVPAAMLKDDHLSGSLTLVPPKDSKNIRVLVSTTQDSLATTTTLLHPAKAFAIARSTQPPAIKDPIATHTDQGNLMLTVDIVSEQKVQATQRTDYAPSPEERSSYYLNSIKNAVNNGDLDKAMKLLDEAETLGIQEARPTFIKAVEAKK
ncbi:hypothetical protein A3K86_19445 [Photobacterium jeanii]|uniref:Transcriptional regulator n=1 Tax=Photobacterium jeanii TaxID=858640 RepID=A0A178K347_9GAMM|nr:MalM family protein [Photobacterium jeanii]OAN11142.1 hypothetical protein A3K86_19445 [Photobacterium jeanii]PST90661.1 hypothetical protein C9I91_08545 [Photobacterium jeanii]